MVDVLMQTSEGPIRLALDPEAAPKTVDNFLAYANKGFYDGTLFHRVVPGFVIQGGGMEPGMHQKQTDDPIPNEADNGLKNERGAICMARTSDPHSATSQFFINLANNAFLDHSGKTAQGWGYCVFGRITEGMEAVDGIAGVATGRSGMHADVPSEDVLIQSIEVVEN